MVPQMANVTEAVAQLLLVSSGITLTQEWVMDEPVVVVGPERASVVISGRCPPSSMMVRINIYERQDEGRPTG